MTLVDGDAVALIAPASQLPGANRILLDRAVELLTSWGLDVRVAVDHGHRFYLAGTDTERVRYLQQTLVDPDIRGIFCVRGGYGSARLLRHLDLDLKPTAKVLVGYSDITALHAYISARYPNVQLIHGPNLATHQMLDDTPAAAVNRSCLRDALFLPDYQVHQPVEFLRGGDASGELFAGCLTILTSLLGTPYMPDLSGTILFLEDVGEAPYRIDRMLTQLRDSGSLSGVQAIVFGRMHNCTDPYNDIRQIIVDVLDTVPIPVAFGLNSGHGPVNLSLPLGARTQLDSNAGTFTTCKDGSFPRS